MNGIFRFINTGIPVTRCNLRCHYCYIGQCNNFTNLSNENLHYSIEHIRKAVKPERLGGVCMFNLCAAGETLFFKELPEVVTMLLESGHFVTVVTNATLTEPLKRLLKIPKILVERLFIKCSFQYLELKRLQLLDRFFDNIQLIKDAEVAFTIELTANDETIPYINEIKDICLNRLGTLCHIIESRNEADGSFARLTKLPLSEHQSAWGQFNSKLFDYQQQTYEQPQHKFCYAGEFLIGLSLQTGDCSQCYQAKKLMNLFQDLDTPPIWAAIGTNCNLSHCYITYHAGLPLVNCYPEIYAPTYAEERDRLCPDNSTWLTPTIREAFSHRCSEYHQPYSADKAYYIDLLMRKVYKGINPSPEEETELVRIVERYLTQKGYRKIAIYGMGLLGEWLIKLLQAANIDVVCGIDRRWAEIKSNIAIQSPEDVIPSADAVIVSVYAEFANIAPLLRKKTSIPLISIVELVPDSE